MKRIAIIGAGDLGQQIAYYAVLNGCHIVGFFDDYETKKEIAGFSVLGKLSSIEQMHDSFDELIMGIGYKYFSERKSIFESLNKRYKFATIIDKSALIDPSAVIEEGSVIFPGVLLDKGVRICRNVLLNVSVTIAHDTVIGSHSFLSPRVVVAGFSQIGECSFIGINSTIIDNIKITKHVQLGGGTVVINNLDISGLYVGVPAILKKKLYE